MIRNTYNNLQKYNPTSSEEVRSITMDIRKELEEERKSEKVCNEKEIKEKRKKIFQDSLIVNFDDKYRNNFLKAREFLWEHYLGHPEIINDDTRAKDMIEGIFQKYSENTKLLPLKTQITIRNNRNIESKYRIIADHIACMTDSYAETIYKGFFH